MPDIPFLSRDFADLLRDLSAEGARFLIVGGFAVSIHGEPRSTGDLDVWVEPTAENAHRVLAALRRFGAPCRDLTVADLSSKGVVYQMGIPPGRIDILTDITGVSFAGAWKSRIVVTFAGVKAPVIGFNDLLKNKRAMARPKDLLDAENLSRTRRHRGRARRKDRGRR